MSKITGLNAGDILLINNGTWYNIKGQKLLRRKSSVNTTHVALSLGDGIFIHADTSCGVDLVFFPDLLNNSEKSWKVIRHIEITDEAEKEIKKAGVFHLNKAYNYGIIFKENEKSLFCSQFVELVYKTIGINIFHREKNKVLLHLNNALPVDFEQLLLDDKKWNDITEIYLNEIKSDLMEYLRPNFQMYRLLINSIKKGRKNHSNILKLTHVLNDSHNLLPDKHKNLELKNNLSEMIEKLNNSESEFFYDFWDIKSK